MKNLPYCVHINKEKCTYCTELYQLPVKYFIEQSYFGNFPIARHYYLKAFQENQLRLLKELNVIDSQI